MIKRLKLFNREPNQIDTYIRMRRQSMGKDASIKADAVISVYKTRSPNLWVESGTPIDQEIQATLGLVPYAENLAPFRIQAVQL